MAFCQLSSNHFLDPSISVQAFEETVEQTLASLTPETRPMALAGLMEIANWMATEASTNPKGGIVITALRRLLGPRGQGNLALGQINPAAGDLAGNAKKIMRQLRLAEALELDLVIFPELALMGYPIRDVITRHPFLVKENLKWLEAIAEKAGETRAAIGFVEPRPLDGNGKIKGKPFFNALAILGGGRVEAVVRKSLLPCYGEFNDPRTFEASPRSGVHPPETIACPGWGLDEETPSGAPLIIHGVSYGFSICEDTWNDDTFFNRPLYERDPMAELAVNGPQVLVNVSASPTRSRKERLKDRMLSHSAERHGIPLVYVNQTGAIDECSFDGGSRAYDAQGKLFARGWCFREQFLIVNPLRGEGEIHPLPEVLTIDGPPQKRFDAHDTTDMERTYQTLLQGIRDYFAKTGFKRAVLGLSGGLDSSVTAVLLTDALGPENVLGVSMPSTITPDDCREDARTLAENLGIGFSEIPIGPITQTFHEQLENGRPALDEIWGAPESGSFAADNVQAITRSTLLRMIGNDYRALPIATSDKSEFYLGYTTVNGDMSGALAPLGDVPKTKVRTLALWLNTHRPQPNVLPDRIRLKPSGADLAINPETGKPLTAEEALMPYEFADEVIWRLEALGQSKTQMITEIFQWETRHMLSAETKRAWLDKFFRRMSASVFKWWVAPPVIIVEGNGSITKTDYHHPITANRIDWSGRSPESIREFLGDVAPVFETRPSTGVPI